MIDQITERQKTLIVNNIVKACKDINQLNRTGYKFIYSENGFIAHYDINGFKAHYDNKSLANDIIQNALFNQCFNFKPADKFYIYMMDKKDIYNRIVDKLTNGKIQFIHLG